MCAPNPARRQEIAHIIDPWAMSFKGHNKLASARRREALGMADDIMRGERCSSRADGAALAFGLADQQLGELMERGEP